MSLKGAFLAMLFAVAAVAPGLADTYNGSVFTSSPISVSAGQEFLIAIPSNPTTGYSWTGKSSSGVITILGSAYQAPTGTGKPLMGAGGEQIFVCKANKPGTAQITFGYARPWQKGVKPARTMTFNATVK
jgi:inhibitor of cysteine peptidase